MPPSLAEVQAALRRLANELFIAQAELARAPGAGPPKHRIEQRHVDRIEQAIDRFESGHLPLASFVLPGGSPSAARIHLARTIARRAERELVALHAAEPLPAELLAWANRVGDLLFALALAANRALGVAEVAPDYTV
jgi:cob(I)alamin adenosyltransferase